MTDSVLIEQRTTLLNDTDFHLSMRISPRGRNDADTRTLLVHRLRLGFKAVLRLSLQQRTEQYGVFCEPCCRWFYTTEFQPSIKCPRCNRTYIAEFVTYTHKGLT